MKLLTISLLLLLMACSEAVNDTALYEESETTYEESDTGQNSENQFGVKLNKIILSRAVDGKNYSVGVSGLPISDEIQK